jgi:hypothetical protein
MVGRSKGGTGADSHGIIIFDIDAAKEEVNPTKKEVLDLVQELVYAKEVAIDSTISSLLIKPVLEYGIPVISNIPRVSITYSDVEKASQIKAKEPADGGISIILDRDLDCIHNGTTLRIASGQMINAIGLIADKKIRSNAQLYIHDYLATNAKYKTREILRAGLFGVYNCYKNYFTSAYLHNPFTVGEKLQFKFDKKTDDNNQKLRGFLDFCIKAIKQIPTKKERPTRSNTTKSEIQELFEWLIANKFVKPNEIKHIEFTVELMQLIEKIKWFNSPNDSGCKKYTEQLHYIIHGFIDAVVQKNKSINANIEISNKKTIAFSKFGTANIYSLSAAQRKNVAQEFDAQQIKKSAMQLLPQVRDLQAAIDQADIKSLGSHLTAIYDIISKDSKTKLDKQIKETELIFTSLIKLDQSAATKAEKDAEKAEKAALKAEKDTDKAIASTYNGAVSSAETKPKKAATKPSTPISYIMEICPHILEYATRLRDGGYVADIENAIANKYGAQASAAQNKRDQRDTYCKLCGSLLAEYDEEDIAYKEKDNYIMSVQDDEIFSMVKTELNYVLSYYMYFPPDSPIKQFDKVGLTDILSSLIRIKILEVQADLIKIKTLADNDMWILINVYIYIYIFAILTQFVFANPSVLQFKHAKIMADNAGARPRKSDRTTKSDAAKSDGEEDAHTKVSAATTPGSVDVAAATAIESTTTKTTDAKSEPIAVGKGRTKSVGRKSIGGKQVNITKSSKEILTDLLQRKESKISLERLSNHALELIKKIKFADINNSKYITMANIRELFLSAYKWTMSLNYNVESVDDMIGKTESEFKQTNIEDYNIVKFFELHGKLGRSYDKIEAEFKDSVSLYATAELGKNAPEDSKLVAEYIVSEKYKIKPIPGSAELTTLIDKFVAERKSEKKRYREYCVRKLRPHAIMPLIDLRDTKLDLPFELSMCGKSCTKTYVYQSGKSKYVEYTRKEIIEWLDNKNEVKLKELYAMPCLGAKCVCKENKNQMLVLFYKYYEQFCPKGEIHEYTEKKCKKCGINEETIKSLDSAYYDKYKGEYVKQRKRELLTINKEIMREVENERDAAKKFAKLSKATEKFSEWKASTKEVAELVKRVPIKNLENLFLNIGLYEGAEYKLLETNKIQPYIEAGKEAYQNQANAVHNYILYVNRNYYTTKNSEYMTKLPPDLKTIFTKAGKTNKDLAKKLTDLDESYVEKYDLYNTQNVEPKLIANFCIAHLAQLFLSILDIFTKAKLEDLGLTWVQFYLAKIIGYERYLCVVKLKNLKPLARFEEEEDDFKYDDNDNVNSKANTENPSVVEDDDEDIDVEQEDDEDNMDNTFITVD